MKRLVVAAAVLAAPIAASAQPAGLDPQCQSVFARYKAAAGPKAFAQGTTRGCGWQVRTAPELTMADIQARAIAQCQNNGGDNCRISASLATGNAGAANAQGRTPACEQAFGRYRAAQGPKAFAQGAGGCGWQVQNSQYPSLDDVKARAVAQCSGNGGAGCRVVQSSAR